MSGYRASNANSHSAAQRVRGLVQEMQQLCEGELEEEVFFEELLGRAVAAMAADGGGVWRFVEGRCRLVSHLNLPAVVLDPQEEDAQQHWRLVQRSAMEDRPRLIEALASGGTGEETWRNPLSQLVVLQPFSENGEVAGVIEILKAADTPPATQQGLLRFLETVGQMIGGWHRNCEMRSLRGRHALWLEAQRFIEVVHNGLDLKATAFAIANETQQVLNCDRVSVAVERAGGVKIEAVSGQDVVDPRSNVVTSLRKLSKSVMGLGEDLWYTGRLDDLPPQIESQLEAYVEQSHARTIVILPLRRPPPVDYNADTPEEIELRASSGPLIGALVIESFGGTLSGDAIRAKTALVKQQSAQAIANSLTHSSLFLMPVWRALGRAEWMFRRKTLPKTIAVGVAVLLAGLFLCLPTTFTLHARGVLQPKVRKHVYATSEGVVRTVHVKSGAPVKAGQKLVTLENTDLELAVQKNLGDQALALQKLAATRDSLGRVQQLSRAERSKLHSDEAQLKVQQANLLKEYELLKRKQASLILTSPVDGVVTTWNVAALLSDRPVTAGQQLVTVANLQKGWELELYMQENRMGHVVLAKQELPDDEKLHVDYILSSDPSVTRHGHVDRIQPIADLHGEDGHAVKIQVAVDPHAEPVLTEPRPGATVTATVNCGTATRGYVWFHEAYEWVQKNLWF